MTACLYQRVLQPLHEILPVGQPRGAVVVGKMPDALLSALQLGDILNRAAHVLHRAGGIEAANALQLDVSQRSVRAKDARTFTGEFAGLHQHAERILYVHAIVCVYAVDERPEADDCLPWIDPENAIGLTRPVDLVARQIPFPAAEVGDALCTFQTRLMLGQIAKRLAGTQNVPGAMAEHSPTDRLADEVRRADFVSAIDRL